MDDTQEEGSVPLSPAEEHQTHAPAPEEHREGGPAGFWVRMGAGFIDGLAMLAVLLVAAFLATLAFGQNQEAAVRAIQAASLVLGACYYTGLTAMSGQTLGKMAAGIRVVTKDGAPVSWGRSFGRWAAYSLSSLTLGIGFLMAGWNKRRRALHDIVAGTRVEYLPETGKGRKAAMAGLGGLFALTAVALALLTAQSLPEQARLNAQLVKEGEVEATLNNLRTVVAKYKDRKGAPPASLEDLKELQDFPALPTLDLPGHKPGNASVSYQNVVVYGKIDGPKLRDTGAWGYVADPKGDPAAGTVFIDCTHTDSQGRAWFQY